VLELGHERREFESAFVEAPQRPIDGIRVPGLLDVPTHAHLGPMLTPRVCLSVEPRRRVGRRRCGIGDPGREQGLAHPPADLRVPHVVDLRAVGLARSDRARAIESAGRLHADRHGGHEHRCPAGLGDAATSDRRIVLECGKQRLDRVEPVRGVGGEAPHQRVPQPHRCAAGLARIAESSAGDAAGQLCHRIAGKRALAPQGLPQRDAQRELIGLRGDRLAEELLGRHVRGGSHQRPVPRDPLAVRPAIGQPRRGPGLEERSGARRRAAGEAEVEHTHPQRRPGPLVVGADHGVVGLEVAMDQPDRVGSREAAASLQVDLEDLAPVPSRSSLPAPDGLAADELHRDERAAVVFPDLVHVGDVRVAELRHRPRLADDGTTHRCGGPVAAQELDRDLAIELGVIRGIHHAHPPGAEAMDQREAPDLVPALLLAEQPRHHPGADDLGLGIALGVGA
jgi:hypothetical protein